jgi:uncharacterized protein
MHGEEFNTEKSPATGMFVLELLIIFGLFWADIHHWKHVVVFSKTPYLFILGWISLRVRKQNWRSVGFKAPDDWKRTILWGIATGCALELLELFLTQPLLIRVFHQPPDLSDLAELRGNPAVLALALLLTWTLAAFGEELVWRGYILNRVADVLEQLRGRWAIALIATSVAFGLAHFDQGVTGVIENAIDGALLCGLYFTSGRNLWLPIIAHGVTDTVDSILLFSGHYPV